MRQQKKDKIIYSRILVVVLLSLFTTQAFADTLCPQVVELSDDGATKTYSYDYGATVDPLYMDDLHWSGLTDGYSTLSIQSVHVFNELESGIGGGYASWHMIVTPFYMPSECEGLAIEDQAECAQDNMAVTDFWYMYDEYSGTTAVNWETLFPGPYATGDICEWKAIEDLERNQLVEYENYVIWDWDALCYEPGTPEYEDLCDPYTDEGDDCFEAKGCADGVIVYLYESDEGWYDDYAASFVLVAGESGEIYRSESGIVDVTFYNQVDQDEDGLSDDIEVSLGTDPENPDTDGDGLSDGDEYNNYSTDPLNTDSDSDGIEDGIEVGAGLDPNDNSDAAEDTDGDGLTNVEELVTYETDFNNPDTDGDSLEDGFEVNTFGSDPNSADTDGDSLTDDIEHRLNSDPSNVDSDSDGLTDGEEVYDYLTSPTNSDTDGDGLSDGTEVGLGTNPNDVDSDTDGLNDGDEVNTHLTNPLSTDSDEDGLNDYDEIYVYETSPIDSDTDDEGLLDGEEVSTYNTDPLDSDTDDDEWSDYQEVNAELTKDPLKFDNLIQTRFIHDFNGDGKSDLVAYYPNGEFRIMTSTGSNFNNIQSWVTGLGETHSTPLVGDFNGDGKVDVALLSSSSGDVTVALSTGSGFSDDGSWVLGLGSNSATYLTGDFDGNGKDDVVVMGVDGDWQTALSNGSGFSNSGSWLNTTYHDADRVLAGDFNQDGLDDLLGFYESTGDVYVSLSNGSFFEEAALWLTSFGTGSIEHFVGDFDGNGQDDFIVYHDDQTLEVATSLGDSFEDKGVLGSGLSNGFNQIAVGEFTGDFKSDIVSYVINTTEAGWENAVWHVSVSNGSYFVSEAEWSEGESSSQSQYKKEGLFQKAENMFDQLKRLTIKVNKN